MHKLQIHAEEGIAGYLNQQERGHRLTLRDYLVQKEDLEESSLGEGTQEKPERLAKG